MAAPIRSLAALAAFGFLGMAIPSGAIAQEANFDQVRSQKQTVPASGECRRVSASYGLNLRSRPSIEAPVVDLLANGARIEIENRGSNGWVPVAEPADGWVSAQYLKQCGSAPAPSNCRKVDANYGLNVREAPNLEASVVRTLENGRFVNLEAVEPDGWVEIDAPTDGYVASRYLDYCSVDQQERLR
jgi:uncharacterized protein YgiM (DUF1202 family)